MNAVVRVAVGLAALAVIVGGIVLVGTTRTGVIAFAALVVLVVAYMIGDVLLSDLEW